MATVAVFIAIGGTSYAALEITGKHIVNGSLTGKDVKNKSVNARGETRPSAIRPRPARS